MRLLASIALLVLAVPSLSGAQEQRQPVPQRHELQAALDVLVERELSGGNASLRYTFLAQPLDRIDENVLPVLRRFIYHPNALWIGLRRITTQLEQITGAAIGGTLSFGGGVVTLDAEIGFESTDVRQDPIEPGYLSSPFRVELQTHVLPRTRLGAYVEGRPVLKATSDSVINNPSSRDGNTLEVGATAAGASCGDVLYGELRAGWKMSDWTFSGSFAGGLQASGPTASALGMLQMTPSSSLGAHLEFESLAWENTRSNDQDRLDGPLDPRAMRVALTLEFIYWYRGTYGIKVGLGGGIQQRRPIFDDETTGFGHFGFGIISRF